MKKILSILLLLSYLFFISTQSQTFSNIQTANDNVPITQDNEHEEEPDPYTT